MNAPFSSKDIATLVSPMRGAAVAMPAASRVNGRDLAERWSIVADNDELEGIRGGRWYEVKSVESRMATDITEYLPLFPRDFCSGSISHSG